MSSRITLIFEKLFFLLIASFFLKLGSDTLEGPGLRLIYLGFLLIGFLIAWKKKGLFAPLKSIPFLIFLSFLAFEVVRFLWLRFSPVTWIFYFGFFTAALLFFKGRGRVHRLLWVLAWSGFLLALTAIPPLLIKGHAGYLAGYLGEEERYTFFPPFFYFHEFISRHLLARYAHPNYVGDVIALGFFPTLGLFFYSLQARPSVISAGLSGLLAATEALAIVLFFSRAAIVCWAAGFLIFLLAAFLKFPSRRQLIFSGAVFLLVAAFLIWAGNVQGAWKELRTLKGEGSESEIKSFGTNIEGAKRAVRIYRAFPVWGVGTRGYSSVSESFRTPGTQPYAMRRYKAFCHYLQTLAEEGSGAFLYFLFLLAYFFEITRGLLKTRSRFQFMAGLSLGTAVVMILAHAAVKPVMDYFAAASLVFLLMGALLGLLHDDGGEGASLTPQ